VWETGRYRRIGDFPTGGIGPHEIRLMPDGQHLVIANGGIETRGREKLNLDRMRPSLVYTTLDGAIIDEIVLDPELRQNSIRHLATRPDGLVGFAMQWQGAANAAMPLVGLHRMGETPVLAQAPLADELAMNGYAGSIAFAGNGQELAITSPRGGRLHRFGAAGNFIAAVTRADICGLAPMGTGYLASDGLGGLIAVDDQGARALARTPSAWDNHLIALGQA